MCAVPQARALALVVGVTAVLVLPLPPLADWSVLGGWSPGAWRLLRLLAWIVIVLGLSLRGPAADSLGTALILIAGAALGFTTLGQDLSRHWPEPLAGTEWQVQGVVSGPPVRGDGYQRVDLRVTSINPIDGLQAPRNLPLRIRVSLREGGPAVSSGDEWSWRLRLQPPNGRVNRGGFDRRAWLIEERVHAVAALATGDGPAPVLVRRSNQPSARLGCWREWLRDRVFALNALDDTQKSLVSALTLGIGDQVPARVHDALRATGTSHLLAISGLHVTVVFGVLWWLLRVTFTRITAWRDGALIAAVVFTAVYAALAGFDLPVRRALMMLLVASLVLLRRRFSLSSTALSLAVITVVLFDPLTLLGAGFWLSAGSVAFIVWLQAGRMRRGVVSMMVGGQLFISLAMLIPGAWWFQEISVVSPLANLFAIPWTTMVVVPSALLVTALSAMAPALAEWPAALLGISINGLLWALLTVAAIEGAHWPASLPGVFGLVTAAATVALLTAPWRRPWLGFMPFFLLPAVQHVLHAGKQGPIELHVLDVGHGVAALILADDHAVLVDTGGGRAPYTRVQTDVIPHLLALGRRSLSHLIVSHPDQDHAAGLLPLLAWQPGLPVYAGDLLAAQRVVDEAGLDVPPDQMRGCEAGSGFDAGPVRIDFLHPAAHDRGSDNDRSCVVLVHGAGFRVLLPGDIEAAGERNLVERAGFLPVDVLLAPHHGSNSSSTLRFVDAFPARHVVFPAARRSRWSFPHVSVQMRYTLSGAALHHPGDAGALVFRFGDDVHAPKVMSLGRESQRLWRAPLRRTQAPHEFVVSATNDDN